ncbi:MAG: polysaccharide biosynthesis tyrosine autokinase [Rhodobacteraceae bacterium]|nr:polysaccharide biosynthesis tyrosine autokinase [Paracoccaceae bacterium]
MNDLGTRRTIEPRSNVSAISPGNVVSDTDDEIDLIALFSAVWRGKWIIIFCATIALLLGGYYAFEVAVPKYRATTTLALQIRNEQVVDLQSVLSGVSTESAALNTELEVMRSRSLMLKLVNELDLTADPEFNATLRPAPQFSVRLLINKALSLAGKAVPKEDIPTAAGILNAAIGASGNAIAVSNTRNTYVFNINATTENPVKSALISNTLANLYIQDQIDIKFQATENAVAWLSDRVTSLEIELRDKEDAIKQLHKSSELVSAEALVALNRQASDVRNRLEETRSALGTSQVRVGELQDLRAAGDPAALAAAANDPALTRLLNALGVGGQDALNRFNMRADLIVRRAGTDMKRNQQQSDALAASYIKLQDRSEAQAAGLLQLQQLEREATATKVLYETFLTRLKETTVQRGLQRADSRILSEATPGRYVEPRKSRILALSLILGAMFGVAIVLGRQFLHTGFRTADELEQYTGTTVLGQIPKMPVRTRRGLIKYLRDKPTSASSEAIRNLRTSVLLSDIDSPPKVIMSTSSVPGEGKTTQSISLAHNMSGLGKKVLLIEGDIRRRAFTEYFDQKPKGGLLSALQGEVPISDLVFFDERLGVDVLMGEKTSVNAADIFSSDRFKEFIDRARGSYDFVIIDTPPVLVVPDARVIGQSVDAIIFSVFWDKTSKSQVVDALRQFSSVNLKVTGLVLAQVDPKGMKRYGHDGKYGAYSRYGKKYYGA